MKQLLLKKIVVLVHLAPDEVCSLNHSQFHTYVFVLFMQRLSEITEVLTTVPNSAQTFENMHSTFFLNYFNVANDYVKK